MNEQVYVEVENPAALTPLQFRIAQFEKFMNKINNMYAAERRTGYIRRSRDRDEVGYADIKLKPAVRAGEVYRAFNYTVNWDYSLDEISDVGAKSIWMYVAYMYPHDHNFNPYMNPDRVTKIDRAKLAEKWMAEFCQGFEYLRENFYKEYGILILSAPRRKGSSRLEYITLDYDLKVNDSQTAHQRYSEYVKDRTFNLIKKGIDRLTSLDGTDSTREYAELINTSMNSQIAAKEKNVVESEDQDDESSDDFEVPEPVDIPFAEEDCNEDLEINP